MGNAIVYKIYFNGDLQFLVVNLEIPSSGDNQPVIGIIMGDSSMIYKDLDALQSLRPKAEWTWIGYEYSGLDWLDSSQTKPTESEINAEITRLNNAEPMRLLRLKEIQDYRATDWTQSRDVTIK